MEERRSKYPTLLQPPQWTHGPVPHKIKSFGQSCVQKATHTQRVTYLCTQSFANRVHLEEQASEALFSLLSCRTKKKRKKKEKKEERKKRKKKKRPLLLVHYLIWVIWSQIFCLNVTPLFFFFFFCGRKTSSYSLTPLFFLFLLLLLTDKTVYQLCLEIKLLKNIVIFF